MLLMTLPNKKESVMLEHIVGTTESSITKTVEDPVIEGQFNEVTIDYFVIHLSDGSVRGVEAWKLPDFNKFVQTQVTLANLALKP